MRRARFLLPLLAALAAAGCARQQQQTYYIVDPQTGQMVPVVQQYSQQPQQYAQPQYVQQDYAQQPAYQPPQPAQASPSRGLFARSPAAAQQSYGQPTYMQGQAVYAQAPAPVYAPQPQVQPPQYQQPAYQQQPQQYQPAPQAQTAQRVPGDQRGLFNRRGRSPQSYPQPQVQQPQYGVGGPYVAAPNPNNAYAYAAPTTGAYTLDAGDKLRIVVFGQDGITNSYTVGVDGNVNLPLIGSVPARGSTTQMLSQAIAAKLKQGYVREPHVSVEVEAYRPFFILGEVTTPGQYPYVANMTAETAIAIAGGFSARANKRTVELSRNVPGQQFKGDVPLNYPLRPGDTVVVKERWF